jgi:hypothetical protein
MMMATPGLVDRRLGKTRSLVVEFPIGLQVEKIQPHILFALPYPTQRFLEHFLLFSHPGYPPQDARQPQGHS